MIFLPSKNVTDPPDNMNIEEVFFETEDNLKLHAWYLDNNSNETVLFFHGNAGNLTHRTKQLEVFNELQVNALIFDYRGYGKSEGEIKEEEDLYSDSNAAVNYLLEEKDIDLKDIIIWGRSVGGAIAIDTAQNKEFAAVIIESTFSSVDKMASEQFWFLPIKFLLKFHFSNDEKIGNINSRLLIVHSKDDEMIAFSNGGKLFLEAKEPKTFLEISGSHNYGFQDSYSTYIEGLKVFLDKEDETVLIEPTLFEIDIEGYLESCIDEPVIFIYEDGDWIKPNRELPGKEMYFLDGTYYGYGMCDYIVCNKIKNPIQVSLVEYVKIGEREAPADSFLNEGAQVPEYETKSLEGEIKIELNYYTDSQCNNKELFTTTVNN